MARKFRAKGGELFIGETRQLRIADKSAEQQAMEQKQEQTMRSLWREGPKLGVGRGRYDAKWGARHAF